MWVVSRLEVVIVAKQGCGRAIVGSLSFAHFITVARHHSPNSVFPSEVELLTRYTNHVGVADAARTTWSKTER